MTRDMMRILPSLRPTSTRDMDVIPIIPRSFFVSNSNLYKANKSIFLATFLLVI